MPQQATAISRIRNAPEEVANLHLQALDLFAELDPVTNDTLLKFAPQMSPEDWSFVVATLRKDLDETLRLTLLAKSTAHSAVVSGLCRKGTDERKLAEGFLEPLLDARSGIDHDRFESICKRFSYGSHEPLSDAQFDLYRSAQDRALEKVAENDE